MSGRIRLKHLSAIPITNGLGLSGQHDNPDWPRYVRTTDIAGPRSLRDDAFASQPPDVAAEAMLAPNDIVACAAGTIGKSMLFTSEDPACFAGFLVRIRPGPNADAQFLSYWMQSKDYWAQIEQGAVKSTIENFSASRFRAMSVPNPPLDEQRRIADFLDDRVSRIDRIIAARREQELLVEARFSSGVDELLSELPLVPVRRLVREVLVGIVIQPSKIYTESADGVSTLRGLNVKEGFFDLEELVRITPEGHRDNPRSVLGVGDVVVVRTGDAGSAAVVGMDMAGWNCVDLVIVRGAHGASPEYVAWMLNASRRSSSIASASSGSIQQHFGAGAVAALPVPFAPPERQSELVRQLDGMSEAKQRHKFDLARSIELLIEYKSSLITAAVMGELDVSTAGSSIPG